MMIKMMSTTTPIAAKMYLINLSYNKIPEFGILRCAYVKFRHTFTSGKRSGSLA